MKNYLELSFLNCIEKMQQKHTDLDIRQLDEMVKRYNSFAAAPDIMPTIYILDFKTQEYPMVSENAINLTGYDAKSFMEGGVPFFVSICEKDDFDIFNDKIFPKTMSELSLQPQEDHAKCVFSHDFRIHTKNKEIKRLHQRSTYITSTETGAPLFSVGLVSDISNLKKDNSILHQLEKIKTHTDKYESEVIFTKLYYPYSELFSKREIEVLKLLAEGMNTFDIADKLNNAESTISNHRKSMMEKSKSKNVAQLITFSIRNNII